MITQSGPNAYANLDDVRAGLDASARKRADRLARATAEQMEAALALLSMLDPEAFEIAFTAVPIASDDSDDEPIPVCRECGGLAGIFPDHGLRWQHFRGDGTTSGAQQIYEPGHDRLTPARVRRGFRNIRAKTTQPAGAPKPGKPGPGRPPGSKNRRPAARYDVGKTTKREPSLKARRDQAG